VVLNFLKWAFKIAPNPCSLVLFPSEFEPQGKKRKKIPFLLPAGWGQEWLPVEVTLGFSTTLNTLHYSHFLLQCGLSVLCSKTKQPWFLHYFSNNYGNKVKNLRDVLY